MIRVLKLGATYVSINYITTYTIYRYYLHNLNRDMEISHNE